MDKIWLLIFDLTGAFKDSTEVVYPLGAFEFCLMTINLYFMIQMIPFRNNLATQRSEFSVTLFKKIADKKSNILWQLFFYILKRFHIVLLAAIFIFGMQEINVYFIGLMFFFVSFAASIKTYRVYGK
jgi:hypothetical protein